MTDDLGADERTRIRAERCEFAYRTAVWNAARDAGCEIYILEHPHAWAAACPSREGPAFNSAFGLDGAPDHVDAVIEHYRRHRTAGWLQMARQPSPDAVPDFELSVLLAMTADVPRLAAPDGVSVAVLGAADVEGRVAAMTFELPADADRVLVETARRLARNDQIHVALASVDGRPVGRGSLYLCGPFGALAAAWVAPEFRGRGIHALLISARAAAARDAGAVALASGAASGSTSERNQLRLGFRRVGTRIGYRVDPA